MLNIVIPMAGAGSRFATNGYKQPKPLIPINGIPMIHIVINNLRPQQPHRFIFICQQAHVNVYDLQEKLSTWATDCRIIGINGLTEGAVCTVLAAREYIDNNEPLMIANSDQFIDASIDDFLQSMEARNLDGIIMTMKANDPKWSFVRLNNNNLVASVVEKKVISDEATVGIYNFKQGCDFVAAADAMIAQDLRVNNEFYVAPVYNGLIESGQRIGIFNIGKEADGMYGLGTPADLDLFLSLPIHLNATIKTP